ncbi:cold-regulated 413 plasma membrane protein 2-like [Corylus avellana]|uniref:cold-regulated 413 plasma membrane protein 2-like n=1 Tax=Corylus avellana TaxID=13451 RepID=UPI00286C9E7C|nr:cold-regulated 413 plasma membrane protein 2-like [Corylus avellana]
MKNLGMRFAEVVACVGDAAVGASSTSPELSIKVRGSFQWGGTLSALILLFLNRIGRRSSFQTTLLVLYLFTSFPTALFKILRGQFGCWIAFLAVVANLFWPETFPASRFLLFVVAPDWLADELRGSICSGILCLLIGVLLVITKVRGLGNGLCDCHCFCYCLGIALLFYFTIRYLCLETW